MELDRNNPSVLIHGCYTEITEHFRVISYNRKHAVVIVTFTQRSMLGI